MLSKNNLVNIAYNMNGLRFDAAVDLAWSLHAYTQTPEERARLVPVEIYCFNRPLWDIKLIFMRQSEYATGTAVSLDILLRETACWIDEMTRYDSSEDTDELRHMRTAAELANKYLDGQEQ